mgnify:CR=1 FL=1
MKPILIVDDEAPIRALIRLTLERAGYTCDEAATGTEAADKIEANTYDLALLMGTSCWTTCAACRPR